MSTRTNTIKVGKPARDPLPYGIWRTKDGLEVLFDRRYRPMWQRVEGLVVRADPTAWI